jgi:very-short-patch-repair endonuclease
MMLRLVTEDVVVHHRIGKHSVDIYIPEMNVAIEYQGSQHFQQSWRGNFKRFDIYQLDWCV